MTGTHQEAVVVDDLRKSYGDIRAIDDVSLRVARGEFFGLLGPNGAGKTTLIEIIEGLRTADSGVVRLLGQPPTPRDTALLSRIGVQTQKSAFFTRLTAREHLVTVAALYGLTATAADRTLEQVGLSGSAHVRVTRISGGQRQRLAIASALVHDPEVIFMDEPTAGLDPQARRDLWRLLKELRAAGKTIVYTTHHLDEAEALCDRVAVLVTGRAVAVGRPQDLVARSGASTRLLVPADRLSLERASALDGVDSAELDGAYVVLQASVPGRALASVDAAVGLAQVQTRTATLEDSYLELIGAVES